MQCSPPEAPSPQPNFKQYALNMCISKSYSIALISKLCQSPVHTSSYTTDSDTLVSIMISV